MCEAMPAFATQERGSGALQTIRQTFDERYGGGWLDGERGFGVRIVGLTEDDIASIDRIADGLDLEAEILPATYSRREIVAFIDLIDTTDPNMDPIVGWGPDDTLGKLGIDIESPGVTTVRKLYTIFPPNAISVRCCARMGSFFDPPTWLDRLRDATIFFVAVGVIVLCASRVAPVGAPTR
jgi:hypothetical protein